MNSFGGTLAKSPKPRLLIGNVRFCARSREVPLRLAREILSAFCITLGLAGMLAGRFAFKQGEQK